MPSDLEQLATIKSQTLARLVEITASRQPTYSLDGQSYSWESYHRLLTDQLKAVNELLLAEQPYCVVSQVL